MFAFNFWHQCLQNFGETENSLMDSFYDALTLEHQASGAADENWENGSPESRFQGSWLWRKPQPLCWHARAVFLSLFPLKHKHFHIYSVRAANPLTIPPPVRLLDIMPM